MCVSGPPIGARVPSATWARTVRVSVVRLTWTIKINVNAVKAVFSVYFTAGLRWGTGYIFVIRDLLNYVFVTRESCFVIPVIRDTVQQREA